MNYNLLYSITNIFCESVTYLVPYINSTDFSCSLYSGSITNITVENYFELMQMLSYYNLDYSFVGNDRVEGNTSIILRNGNLIMPCDSYMSPSYVFCDILLNDEFEKLRLKSDVSGKEFKETLDSIAKNLLKKLLCNATSGMERNDTSILSESNEKDTYNILNTQEEEQKVFSKEIENTNKKDEVEEKEKNSDLHETIKNEVNEFTKINPPVENLID